MSTVDEGSIAGLRWHTHWDYNDRPVHTHSHPDDAKDHRHDDYYRTMGWNSLAVLVSSAGVRLPGEVTPMEVMHAALAEVPSWPSSPGPTDGELASARSALDEMLTRLDPVVASPACSCSCHVFGGSYVSACC